MSEIKKVVLAYSGGLDTSIIIPWLKENYNNPEIIAVSADVGQGDELDGLEEKAIKTGASKLYIEDLTDEMVDEVIIPSMMMGAKYEDYLLGTAFARPIIGKRLVEIAKKEGADAICHGCTGKGNDQVRFELAIKRFAPEMKIIAPWREWDIKGRDEEIDYAEAHNVPLKISRETNYSKDKNLWHLSHEGLDLEDPANEPQYDKPGFLEMGVSPMQAPDQATYVTLDFEKGWPVAIDGEKMKASDIIRKLNKLGGENGVGLLDIVLGQSVSTGQKIGQINDLSGYKVEAQIDESYIDRVRAGLEATFDRQGTDYKVRLRKVYPEVRSGQFRADFTFLGDHPENIRSGQTYYLHLELGQPTEAVIIPRGSFYQTTGGAWIYVLAPEGDKAYKRPIRIGRQNPQYYEVLDGLEPGERVIVSGYENYGSNDVLILNK